MTEPGLHPSAPDPAALRRRLLLAAVVTLAAWVVALALLDAVGLGQWYALAAFVVVYLVVTRPLMRPVRAAVALRRRLAYQAWRDQRDGP